MLTRIHLCCLNNFKRLFSTMASNEKTEWCSIPCSQTELRLDISLVNGQSFRWHETKAGEWSSVLDGKLWTLSQTEDKLLYKVHNSENTEECCEEKFLRDYFQLDVNISELYQKWSECDSNFKTKASNITGARVLRQHPVENLFSFICSSNNNISRISQMVVNLCKTYGTPVQELEGVVHYNFPDVACLTGDSVEQKLRELGFGYRAKFIVGTARAIMKESGGQDWLIGLRQESHEVAKAELMKLPGVGAKVADCVCLMSLDKTAAIPIDTHVWQIATRDYNCQGLANNKTLTDKVYRQIGEYFQEKWGSYAGWAQCVLFSAELKKFQTNSPSKSPNKRKQSNKNQMTSHSVEPKRQTESASSKRKKKSKR